MVYKGIPPAVVDANVLIRLESFEKTEMLFTSSMVLTEVFAGGERILIRQAIEDGLLKVKEPSERISAQVKAKAVETGDIHKLSEGDVSIVSLALELGYRLVSDDYSVQNVAKKLNIPVEVAFQKGISTALEWVPRCSGCGKVYGTGQIGACPVCGSEIVLKKKKPI